MHTQHPPRDLEAQVALHTITEALKTHNKSAVIAVADAHGELLDLRRLDGAGLPSIQVTTQLGVQAILKHLQREVRA